MMTTSKKVRPSLRALGKRGKSAWEKYQEVSTELKALEKRISDLKSIRDGISREVVQGMGEDTERRLDAHHVLLRKVISVEDRVCRPEDVGQVIRGGYSYTRFSVRED